MSGYLPTVDWQIGVTPGWRINSVAKPPGIQAAAKNSILRVFFGTTRPVARIANVVPHGSNWVVQAIWGEGLITSLGAGLANVTFNNETPINGGTVTHYLGTAGQTVDATLVAAFAANGITYTDALANIAYSVFVIPGGGGVGLPLIHILLAGMALYDHRTGTTVYSDNPALIVANYAASTIYGMGLTVDWPSVDVVANDNDALVGGVKRRRLNIALEEAKDPEAWLDTLCAYAGCWPIREGNKISFVSDRPAASVASYSHTAGNILSMSPINQHEIVTLPTCMRVFYTNTSQIPWREDEQWAYLPGVLAGATPWRESNIALPGIQDPSQALREAEERLNKLTLLNESWTQVVPDIGLKHQAGDVIDTTHPFGLATQTGRVRKITPNRGRFTLDVLKYDAAVYSNATVSVPAAADTNLPNPLDVAAPAGLAPFSGSAEQITHIDGTVTNRIRLTWTGPTDKFVTQGGEAQLQWKKSADATWVDAPPVVGGSGPTYVTGVVDNTNYDLRLRYQNVRGTPSAWTTYANYTVQARSGGQIGGANLIANTDFDYKDSNSVPCGYYDYNNAVASILWTNAAGVSGGSAFSYRSNVAYTNTVGLRTSSGFVSSGITGGVAGGWLPNKSYVVSFYARSVVGCAAWVNGADLAWNTAPASEIAVLNPVIQSFYQLYVFRITWGASVESSGNLFINLANGGATAINDEFAIDRLMVQRGDIATEWSPNAGAWNAAYGPDKPANNATADLSLVATAGVVTLTGNTAVKTGGTNSTYDGQVISKDGYTGGAFCSVVVATLAYYTMLGLNTDPALDTNYSSVDWHVEVAPSSGNFIVYESGVNHGSIGTAAVGDVIAITYDGTAIRYMKNGTVLRTVVVSITAPLFLDAALWSINQIAKNLRFGPMSSNAWAAVGGAGKPTDYANSGGAGGYVNSDPMLRTPAEWVSGGATYYPNFNAGDGAQNGWDSVSSVAIDLFSAPFPVSPSKTYTVETSVYKISGSTAAHYLVVSFHDAAGNVLNGSTYPTGWPAAGTYHYHSLVNAVPAVDGVNAYSFNFGDYATAKIPAGAVTARIGILGRYSGSGRWIWCGGRVREIPALTVGGFLQSTTFTPGSAGWQIKADGSAEFNGVVISSNQIAASGTLSIGTVTFPAGGTPANSPGGNFYLSEPYIVSSGISMVAWSGGTNPYVVLAGTSGIWYDDGTGSATADRWWGVIAEIVPWTVWSGTSVMELRLRVWTRNMDHCVGGNIDWKVYKVT